MEATSSGPNPLCEVGKTHPRDRHRMRPVEGHPGVWECARHEMFARIVPLEEAEALGTQMWVGMAVKQMYQLCNNLHGAGSDFTEIVKVPEAWAGVEVGPVPKKG